MRRSHKGKSLESPALDPVITYTTSLDDVDWAEMKATLRQDAFDKMSGH